MRSQRSCQTPSDQGRHLSCVWSLAILICRRQAEKLGWGGLVQVLQVLNMLALLSSWESAPASMSLY